MAARLMVGCDTSQEPHLLTIQVEGDEQRIEVAFVDKPWVSEGKARVAGQPGSSRLAVAVAGDLHGGLGDARASAEARVEDELRQRLMQEARPGFPLLMRTKRYGDLVGMGIDRLLRREALPASTIVDEYIETRDYSFGPMTRVHYLVDANGQTLARASREVRRLSQAATREIMSRAGAIALGWLALSFLSSLFDRWTRGYLTWRIRGIAGALGAALFWILWIV
jgi:hypothetical protein